MKQLPHKLSDYLGNHPTPPAIDEHPALPVPKLPLKKLGYITAGVITTALIVWAFRPAPILVDVGVIQRGDLPVTVNAEGKTRVRDRFIIAADNDGHLARITLTEGDAVSAGMVVAQIDPLPLNASVQEALGRLAEWKAQRAGVATQRPKAATIQQAQLRIQADMAAQQQATARVVAAQAAFTQAQRDRDRARQLETAGAVSRSDREVAELNATTKAKELETAVLAAKAAASEVSVASAALTVVQQEQADPDYLLKVYDARIASTEAELAKLRDDAVHTNIRSPAAGKVLRIRQKSAQFVTNGTPLMDIGNPANLELVIDVLSTDATTIKPGDRILVDPDSAQRPDPDLIQARVRMVEPAAFTKVSALGVEEQRVNIIGDLLNAAPPLGDAYRIDTKIITWNGKNILKTPISALFRCNQTAWCVFVVENGKAHQRLIAIDHRNDREAEVQQGLKPGETVVLHPTEQIKDGRQVTPR